MFQRKKKAQRGIGLLLKECHAAEEMVSRLPRQRCLEIYDMLTQAYWPDDLGDKPDGWEHMSYEEKHFILNDAVRRIEDRIPLKVRKRYERRLQYGESEEQFNEWWESRIVELLSIAAGRFI